MKDCNKLRESLNKKIDDLEERLKNQASETKMKYTNVIVHSSTEEGYKLKLKFKIIF